MKISSSSTVANYVKNRALTETAHATKTSISGETGQQENKSITVRLSHKSRDELKAQEIVGSLSDIRTNVVDPIQERIANDAYDISYEKAARRMLDEHS